MGLPALIQQALDLGLHLGHAPGDGFLVAVLVERVGQFEAQPAEAQEQLVRGVRLVFHVEHDLHDVTYRWDVPELGVDARLGGRLGEDFLEFLFLVAGEFRRVLVPGMPGQDRAHPGGLPIGQPFLHRPLGPLNHLRDDADSDSFRGVQDRFGLHPHQRMIVGTLPPPDQDCCFLQGDPDLHAPIISETTQEIHEKYDFVSCQPSLSRKDPKSGVGSTRVLNKSPCLFRSMRRRTNRTAQPSDIRATRRSWPVGVTFKFPGSSIGVVPRDSAHRARSA